MCLCVAGRHRHTRHPAATCRMPLRAMLVHFGTFLHEMVFLAVIMKYFFYILQQHPGVHELLACFGVHCAFFSVLTPCSLVGGYKSLSSLISHTDFAEVSGFLDCFVVSTGKYLGVILNEDNNNQMDLQERIKMLTKHTLWYRKFLKIKTCQTN